MKHSMTPAVIRMAASIALTGLAATTGFAQQAPAEFDGTYSGMSRLIANTSESCAPGRTMTVEVRNGRFTLPWQTSAKFDVTLYADGRFHATAGAPLAIADKRMMLVPTAQGQVHGSALMADYGTRICHYTFEAMRS